MFPARILVIADRPVIRAVARELLARAGFLNVVTRSVAGEPGSNRDDWLSDLVVLDVSSPDFDFAAIAPLRRSLGDDVAPPVLALAGEVSLPTATSLAGAGVGHVLAWPDEKTELGPRVGQILGVPQSTSPGADPEAVETEQVPNRRADAADGEEHAFRLLFADVPAPLVVVGRLSSRVVAANEAATSVTGYAPDELLALGINDLFLDGHRLGALDQVASQGDRGPRRITCRLLTRRGEVKDVEVAIREHTFRGEKAVVLHIEKAREGGDLDHAFANRLLLDPETGLGGRALFHSRLERAVTARGAQERIAVALIALDSVTDADQPQADNDLLKDMALAIRGEVRASDTPAYLGGGRFGLLLEDLRSPSTAPCIAERLLNKIRRQGIAGARLGLAFGDHVRSADELLWRAEQAVAAAKAEEPAALVVFQSPLEGAVRRHTELARDLRAVIANGQRSVEDGTLRLVYQPQVEMATRRVVGVEALARWSHPLHGDVSPDTFIPIAEATGMIADLDALILRRALADARTWGFAELPLAVNVSVVELLDPAYADGVIELLKSAGGAGRRLELEITERVEIQPSSPAEANVARLRAAGVAVSIDDFGTGPAPLSTLAVAAGRIKIDRSFIAGISSGESRAAAALVSMARGLGMDVIAEGVETQEQCAFLVGHGCLLAQGYLFAPPVTAAEVMLHVAVAGAAVVGRVASPAAAVAPSHG